VSKTEVALENATAQIALAKDEGEAEVQALEPDVGKAEAALAISEYLLEAQESCPNPRPQRPNSSYGRPGGNATWIGPM